MLFIDNRNITDPRVNLAIEEYALKHLDINQTYLLFYINEPSIIIGKNQNTVEEINADYVREHNIHVVRRLSGGGAVYHDTGNLNFSFITKDDGNSFHDFKKFTDPVVKALNKLGVHAELTGRNDIQVDEKKISGNAMFTTKGRMFSHGTLMFDSEIENVVSALNVKMDKIQSKGIKSIRSRVTNIRDHLDQDMTMDEFKQTLLAYLFEEFEEVPRYELTEVDWEKIYKISEQRYDNWDWNFGKSPKSNVELSNRFAGGSVEVKLQIERGIMRECKIYGDFFGVGDVHDIEERLIDKRYDREEIEKAIKDINMRHYFGNVTKEEFLDLLY
ncbi:MULTISPECIES: lipoate--protein ligase [Fictibacillus]|uniref:lipoate--protein ligase n=1 Tax=Fictibacillus enclensis TaxID=1017270 RepID=A0A0V8JAN7_9BACL|nr:MULTISPECIES: lipoate--protein ligase [Fictibacillus]KSU84126.1 lipoate--protein ligase [Fictibacillus enclensis]RXZ00260.1 lipoate--protein ligase [Fictibacillus sp. S7]SCB73450.1 lipoate-protein ligase A [Fictibacillus enclensis]